jgi:UDP-N-acetylmuramate--alanine ligase
MSLMRHVRNIHFVGIAGVGMCGIAEVLKNSGYNVSGSDLSDSSIMQHLRDIGIDVSVGHLGKNVENADVVVQSTAVKESNVEIITARALKIPVIPRAEMLAELMRTKQGIAIAGTHGKTTTTSLVSSILAHGGLDPSFVIGGKLNSLGANAKLGQSPYFIAEADESDASFLFLKPVMAVVTNIDEDHMTTYNGDFNQLQSTFLEFLQHLPFYGLAALCMDDPKVIELMAELNRPILTYGFHPEADVQAVDWQQNGLSNEFTVRRKARPDLLIKLNLPGKHNVQNALAAIAIATEIGVTDEVISQALSLFQGVGRRFQMRGEVSFGKGNALLIDDYGHHPREITSTIDAIRNVWPQKRLVHVFQPHRYSRTEALFDEFSESLVKSDEIVLLDIYSAGEEPVDGICSQSLADKMRKLAKDKSIAVTPISGVDGVLSKLVQEGDILLMQGAGSIGTLAKDLSESHQVQVD